MTLSLDEWEAIVISNETLFFERKISQSELECLTIAEWWKQYSCILNLLRDQCEPDEKCIYKVEAAYEIQQHQIPKLRPTRLNWLEWNPKAMNRIASIVLKVLLIRGECHCTEEGQDGGEIYLGYIVTDNDENWSDILDRITNHWEVEVESTELHPRDINCCWRLVKCKIRKIEPFWT